MPQYNEAVIIDGTQDDIQLQVQGHNPQTEPLQTWETSAGDTLAQVTHDGRLQIGDIGLETADALIEAHRDDDSTGVSNRPQRGFHSAGYVGGLLNSLVSWVVQELTLIGSDDLDAEHQALRVRLTNQNTGTMGTGAKLRAALVEFINSGGSSSDPVPEASGLHVTLHNQAEAHLDTAYGIKIDVLNEGVSDPEKTYALHTGIGLVHLGDTLELQLSSTYSNTPPTDVVRIYPGSDGKLYAKNWYGTEYDLTGGGEGGVGVPTGIVISYAGAAAPQDWLLCDGKALSRTAYADLFAVIGAAFNTRATLATRTSDTEGVFAFTDVNHGLATGSAMFNLFWFNEVATISGVNISTEVITTSANHYFTTGNRVWISSTANVPAGLSANTDYYVRVLSATTLSLHPTYNDAVANTNKINLTSAGTGTRLITPKDIASRSGVSITNVSGDQVTFSGGTGDNLPIVGTIHEIECLSDQFFLPDLRGRVAVGTGHGIGLSNRILGERVGEENHTLTITEMPAHNHNTTGDYRVLRSAGADRSTPAGGVAAFNPLPSQGGGMPHNNIQPSMALNYIIKT